MAVTVFNGVLKELGPCTTAVGVPHSIALYSYIEFTDGQMLRNVAVFDGLDGKLQGALSEHGPVELHAIYAEKGSRLVAVRANNGRIYASEIPGGSFAVLVMSLSLVFCGVLLLPVLGLGLIFFWWAWRAWQGQRLVNSARTHVRALPNAIFL